MNKHAVRLLSGWVAQQAGKPPVVVSLLRRTGERLNLKAMGKLEIRNDRTVLSTENNGYAGSERDENLIEEDLVDTEIPVDDRIPDGIDEIVEDDRPVYDEEGYRHDPGE